MSNAFTCYAKYCNTIKNIRPKNNRTFGLKIKKIANIILECRECLELLPAMSNQTQTLY